MSGFVTVGKAKTIAKRCSSSQSSILNPQSSSAQDTIKKTTLALLARREHSVQEILQKLTARGFASTEVEETLKPLIVANCQSDQRFAEQLTRNRAGSGWGPIRIQNELKQKGIVDEVIQCVILNDSYDWNQLAREACRKKYHGKKANDYSEKTKQMRFLQYRGFTLEQIRSAIETDEDIFE